MQSWQGCKHRTCIWAGTSTRAREAGPLGRPAGKVQLPWPKGKCPEGTVQVLHGVWAGVRGLRRLLKQMEEEGEVTL